MSPTARRFFGCGLPIVLAVAGLATCGLVFYAGRVVAHTVVVTDDAMKSIRAPGATRRQFSLQQGDVVTVVNTLIWSSEPLRGMVVCLERPEGFVFRRVVALPGDRIAVRDGVAYVDGIRHEPALYRRGTGPDQPEITLGPGEFFVLADDRDQPDSRAWGPIPRDALVGEPQFYSREGLGDRIPLRATGIDAAWMNGPEQAKRDAAATAEAGGGR